MSCCPLLLFIMGLFVMHLRRRRRRRIGEMVVLRIWKSVIRV
jgi:hypothetical protein